MTSTLSPSSPLSPAELQQLRGWSPENFAYIRDRVANHGLTPEQLLAEFPPEHRSEALVAAALPDLEISHRIPQSLRPDLASDLDNIVLEVSQEFGGRNQFRHQNLMHDQELLEVQQQTEVLLDARAAELAGSDPLLLGHTSLDGLNAADATAMGGSLDPELFSSHIASFTAEAGWQQGLSSIGEHVLEFLAEMGIPVASVTVRGAAALWPFLRSIDWKRFCSDWHYTIKTLNRAMKAWREGGWKEACKALMLGVMVAHVPHLATVAAALGLAGIGALGVRWLASRRFMQNTPLAAVLQRIAAVLTAVAGFLRGVFQLVERITDVVLEGASRVVKQVVAATSTGAQQLIQVCSDLTTRAFRASGRALSNASRVAGNLCSWVSGWFFGRGGDGWAAA
jgi:hypothetical protein